MGFSFVFFLGIGCDGRGIITVLAHRDSSQRAKIREVYKNMFQEGLCERIKRELHGNFKVRIDMYNIHVFTHTHTHQNYKLV